MMSRLPPLRDKIENHLKADPELERFVGPLSSLDVNDELALHNLKLTELRSLTNEQLEKELAGILKTEKAMDDDVTAARASLCGPELQIGSFEFDGVNGRHEAFKTIIRSFGIL